MKRWIDFLVGSTLLILLLPIAVPFAVGVFVLDPALPWLQQERVGQYGRRIRVFKLRTMYRDAEHRLVRYLATDPAARREYDTYRCLADDPRVIPVFGNIARKYSVDEIPQLLNVIRGDISLVGPRTLARGDLDELFDPESQKLRLSVPQGLTGLWQVYREGKHEAFQNMRHWDLEYVRTHSLRLDLFVLVRTVRAVLSGTGAF